MARQTLSVRIDTTHGLRASDMGPLLSNADIQPFAPPDIDLLALKRRRRHARPLPGVSDGRPLKQEEDGVLLSSLVHYMNINGNQRN